MLATGQRAPRNQLMHVGVTCGIAHFFAFHAGPNRRSNDFTRLRHNVAEADSGVFARVNQVRMVAACRFPQGFPCFFGNMAVGFGRQRQNHFCRIDRGFQFRLAFTRTFRTYAVQFAQEFHFVFRIPRHAFTVVVDFFQQRTNCRIFFIYFAVITFHHGNVRHGFSWNRLAFAQFPVFRIKRLTQFARAVVHQRR